MSPHKKKTVMKRIFLYLICAALCLTSCKTTKDILYRGSMFGTMQGAWNFLGDDGRTYRFTNIESSDFMPKEGRLVAMFDVYEKVNGSDNSYLAEILDYSVPLSKDPVTCSTKEEEAALGDDPIRMDDGNWSGEYLNMLCTVMLEEESNAVHEINLQIVPGATPDTLHVVLRHNAGEATAGEEGTGQFIQFPFYASFPLADKIAEGKTTTLEIKWFWDSQWSGICTPITK